MHDRNAAQECPAAPAADATVYARTLHRACLVLGGVEPLAAHLQVPVFEVLAWVRGEAEPPEPVFIACVEVILLQAEGRGPAN